MVEVIMSNLSNNPFDPLDIVGMLLTQLIFAVKKHESDTIHMSNGSKTYCGYECVNSTLWGELYLTNKESITCTRCKIKDSESKDLT